MNKKLITFTLPIIIIGIAIVLLVLSIIFLPDNVITQFSCNTGGVSRMPKLFALIIPTLLSIGGVSYIMINKNQDNYSLIAKCYFISIIGIIVYIIMLLVNIKL